jgi:hypothetical protein
MIEIILPFLVFGLGYVDGIDQHFGVVHGTPPNKTTVVTELWKLVLLDVAVDSLLDIEVAFSHCSFCTTADNYIVDGVRS